MQYSLILDASCSHHMTGRQDILCELIYTFAYTIGLPNGTVAMGVQEGHINLSSKLKINHVHYITQLRCNLVFCFPIGERA